MTQNFPLIVKSMGCSLTCYLLLQKLMVGALEWGRARQGLIPDFRMRLPTPEGTSDCLAELKFVSAGVTWYPRGAQGRGTDRRAGGLQSDYKRKLARYDQRFHGTGPGQTFSAET